VDDGASWNSAFLRFALIAEVATEKASQFKMPLKPAYNINICFSEKDYF
jgi:hypothetical protein